MCEQDWGQRGVSQIYREEREKGETEFDRPCLSGGDLYINGRITSSPVICPVEQQLLGRRQTLGLMELEGAGIEGTYPMDTLLEPRAATSLSIPGRLLSPCPSRSRRQSSS
jgi:hypothetical protein